MEVILLEPIKNLGSIGDVVNVKNGFARNFLIPNGMVLFASNENKAEFESRKAEIIKKNDEKKGVASKVADAIKDKFITIIRQAGDDGRLFGSVSSKDIADNLNESFKVQIKKSQIELSKPIKYIGVHVEEVSIHGDVSVTVHVNVARSEDEAKELKEEFLNPTEKKDENEAFAYENYNAQSESDSESDTEQKEGETSDSKAE